jgi:hypothetical protein
MTKNNQRAQDERAQLERDRRIIATPSEWTLWPRLPMKLRSGDWFNNPKGHGFLLANTDPVKPVIYYGNVFMKHDPSKIEFTKFESMDALLAVYTVD